MLDLADGKLCITTVQALASIWSRLVTPGHTQKHVLKRSPEFFSTCVLGDVRQGNLLTTQAVDSFQILRNSYNRLSRRGCQSDKDVSVVLDYLEKGIFATTV